MYNKPEVYSVAVMLYCSSFKSDLEKACSVSGIENILSQDEHGLDLTNPDDYHITLSYIEFQKEDWSEAIQQTLHDVILSALQDLEIHLTFKRLGVLYKYFFAEFHSEHIDIFKKHLLTILRAELPQGIYGFETEYFPHVTLARFYVPSDRQRIIKRELITTHILGTELVQPDFVNPLFISRNCVLKIGVRIQPSNFIQ